MLFTYSIFFFLTSSLLIGEIIFLTSSSNLLLLCNSINLTREKGDKYASPEDILGYKNQIIDCSVFFSSLKSKKTSTLLSLHSFKSLHSLALENVAEI